MAIRSFTVGPAKGLQRAAWDDLPNFTVIAGPNGVGKSTLLHQLWVRRGEFAEPGTEVIYVAPHRSWRKSTLPAAAMFLGPRSYRSSLSLESIPSFELFVPPGFQYAQGQPRLPDSIDEAQSLVKYAITKMEYRRLQLLQRTYEEEGQQIPLGVLPDVFGPLRELTRYLLPHLEFSKIDISDERNVRCLFRRADGDVISEIDIDDLSSGEKAVIALFLPFLETRIDRLIGGPAEDADEVLPTALIDEPELHLHPMLQVALVDYMRSLADAGTAQFVITTHSPTILDALQNQELFLLAPVSSVGDGNQLVRITDSEERLEAVRDLTGSTHLVTRCRPLIFIEGGRPGVVKQVTDQRLLELLVPEASAWVLVPRQGRQEAISAARSLRDVAMAGLRVSTFALVDADQAGPDDPDFAITWGVAMVENLLLDPQAIWDLLSPHREALDLNEASDVDTSLRDIARGLELDEVRLRVLARFKPICIRVSLNGDADEGVIDRAEAEFHSEATAKWPTADVTSAINDARSAVAQILNESRELEAFRGKEILKAFFDAQSLNRFFSYQGFCYALAARATQHSRLAQLIDPVVLRIQRYIPPDLTDALDAALQRLEGDETGVAVAAAAREGAGTARTAWEAGDQSDVDSEGLRQQVVQTARAMSARGESDVHDSLLRAAVQIGDG